MNYDKNLWFANPFDEEAAYEEAVQDCISTIVKSCKTNDELIEIMTSLLVDIVVDYETLHEVKKSLETNPA